MAKFKKFFQKNFGNNWAFANSIFNQFKYIFQYQQKSILEWATYLKYLQSILLEYNLVKISAKLTILRYFQMT